MKCLQRGTVIVALGASLLACGQKGPLVLPDAPAKHKHSVPPLASPAKPAGGAPSAPNTPVPESTAPASGAPSNQAPAVPPVSFNGGGFASLTLRA